MLLSQHYGDLGTLARAGHGLGPEEPVSWQLPKQTWQGQDKNPFARTWVKGKDFIAGNKKGIYY